MKKLDDKTLAKRLLQTRDSGGYSFSSHLQANVKRYAFLAIYFAVILVGLAFAGLWPVFCVVFGIAAGAFLRDIDWVTGIKRTWPFSVKVTDWEKVQRLSEDEPLA